MQLWKTVQGLHSMPKDRYALYHRMDGGEWRRLPQPMLTYRADPFLLEWKGETWIFFEEFEYLTNKGRLALCRPDGSDGQLLMDRPYHMSYPFPLQHEGRLWLLPESCANRTVDLYECMMFPDRWRHARTLLQGIDACDPTLLQLDGYWWLFVAVRPQGESQRHLEIYFNEDLLADGWQAHPINVQRLYAGLRNQSGRPGGAFFQHEGEWVRPAQYSPDYYGQGLAYRQLVKLSTTEFEERGVEPAGYPWRRNHHFSQLGNQQVINRKERVGFRNRPIPLIDPWRD